MRSPRFARVEDGARRGWSKRAAVATLISWSQVSERAAEEVVAYLGAALSELGALPTKSQLIFERFFDEAGGMQFVVHSPYGAA